MTTKTDQATEAQQTLLDQDQVSADSSPQNTADSKTDHTAQAMGDTDDSRDGKTGNNKGGQPKAKNKKKQAGKKKTAKKKTAKKKNGGKKGGAGTKKKKAKNKKGKRGRAPTPKNDLLNVEEGKTRRATAKMTIRLFTRPGLRTMVETVYPTTWIYRDIVAALAQNGLGPAIADINNVLNERADAAIALARETEQKMSKHIDVHAEELGCEIELQDLGEGHRATIVSVGGVIKRLFTLARVFDQAVIRCDTAFTVDAVPHNAAYTAVSRMIEQNRAILAAAKIMARHIRRRLPEQKISIEDMRAYVRESIEAKNLEQAKDQGQGDAPLVSEGPISEDDRKALDEKQAAEHGGEEQPKDSGATDTGSETSKDEQPEQPAPEKPKKQAKSVLARVLGGGRSGK